MTGTSGYIAPGAILALFVLFTFLITIVLFNAIIAIMGSKYEEAMETSEERPGASRLSRARMIIDLEATISIEILQNRTSTDDLIELILAKARARTKTNAEVEELGAKLFDSSTDSKKLMRIADEYGIPLAEQRQALRKDQFWLTRQCRKLRSKAKRERRMEWMPAYLHVLKPRENETIVEVPGWAKDSELMEKLDSVGEQTSRIADAARPTDHIAAVQRAEKVKWEQIGEYPYAAVVQTQTNEIEVFCHKLVDETSTKFDVDLFVERCKDLHVSNVSELRTAMQKLGELGVMATLK
eukprot:SAG11_NODE_5454_length_1555_cov_1.333791_1_plen_296_part_10